MAGPTYRPPVQHSNPDTPLLDIGRCRFYVCRVKACPAKRTGYSDVAEVVDGYRARSCLKITAVVVQADALDKGGEEKQSRRHGAKQHWVLEKHRIVMLKEN